MASANTRASERTGRRESPSAQDALDGLRNRYLEAARRDLCAIESALAKAADRPCAALEIINTAAQHAHDMRGQGATFGFPLITEIAGSLSDLLHSREDVRADVIAVAELHVQSLRVVLEHDIRSAGHPVARSLIDRLNTAVSLLPG